MITKYNLYEGFLLKEKRNKNDYTNFRNIFDKLVDDLHIIFKEFGEYAFSTSIKNYKKNIQHYRFDIDFGPLGYKGTLDIYGTKFGEDYTFFLTDRFFYPHGYQDHFSMTLDKLYEKINDLKNKYEDEKIIADLLDDLMIEDTLENNIHFILFTDKMYNFMVDYILSEREKYINLINFNRCSDEIKNKWEHLKNAKNFDLL